MGVEVGIASVIAILVLIYAGIHVAVALGLVSFIGVWIYRDSVEVAISLLAAATHDTIAHAVFANIPLFALMGIVASEIGLGADVYKVAEQMFRRVRGGLGMATVAANALFASITGSSIASASVFTRIAVPEMRRFGYTRQFSVGVVAGSSVLGMLIPPSSMLIIYAIVAEVSVGHMFIAGFIPGIILATAFILGIVLMARAFPKFIRRGGVDRRRRGRRDDGSLGHFPAAAAGRLPGRPGAGAGSIPAGSRRRRRGRQDRRGRSPSAS